MKIFQPDGGQYEARLYAHASPSVSYDPKNHRSKDARASAEKMHRRLWNAPQNIQSSSCQARDNDFDPEAKVSKTNLLKALLQS